jgi:SAM-dependent methyltransferase
VSEAAIWHEVECGGYAADLETWEALAAGARGPVLELGSGGGRVALHLARRGAEVWALDVDPSLLASLRAKAAGEGLAVETVCADTRAFAIERRFSLTIAPMQLLQMLAPRRSRVAALERVAAHLEPGGLFAAAIVDSFDASPESSPAGLPDVLERDGWVYSSLPVAVAGSGHAEIRRLRHAVSPDGALRAEEHVDRLEKLTADELEAELSAAGLDPRERVRVPAADGYSESVVVLAERY